MQRCRHISRHQDCTFGKAEKWVLLHFESIDNQCVYLYQNHSDSTGKEKDVETGYGYFGARYMDHELMTMWLSVDPMSDKYPSISPYAYCAWNPVKLVDPNGEFGVPMHKRMARKALRKHSSLGNSQQRQIVKATGWYSDINQGDMPIHFDNHNPNSPFDKGVENIKSVFESAIENYGDNIKNGDYREAGVNLHTIADFYSHSNYVEICQEYFGDAIKSVTDIPLYSEVYENREKYAGLIEILETELKTGVYNYDNVFEDKFTHDGNSHRYMNHDSPRSRMGKRRFNGIKGFDYAYSLAEREIIKTVSRKKEGQ